MIAYSASPFLRVAAADAVGKPHVIRVQEFSGRAVRVFRRHMQAAIDCGQPIVPIVVDSYGGQIYSAFAMLDIIAAARVHTRVATIAEGKAMSAGLVLLSGGDKGLRYIAPNATAMLHNGSGGFIGKISDMRTNTDELDRINKRIFDLLDKNAGHKAGHFECMVRGAGNTEIYLDAGECVKSGLADQVGFPQMMVSIDVQFVFGVPKPPAEQKTEKTAAKTRNRRS